MGSGTLPNGQQWVVEVSLGRVILGNWSIAGSGKVQRIGG